MARYLFQPRILHPARLRRVWRKPLVNRHTQLLRLEFEVFEKTGPNELKSTGKIASQDLAISGIAAAETDPSVRPYAEALGIRRPGGPDAWLALSPRDTNNTSRLRKRGKEVPLTLRRQQPWVVIVFADRDDRDMRNPFREIRSFDPTGWEINEHPYDPSLEFVTTNEAASMLGKSPSTIQRLVNKLVKIYGKELVDRTTGRHRRINIAFLRNLVDD